LIAGSNRDNSLFSITNAKVHLKINPGEKHGFQEFFESFSAKLKSHACKQDMKWTLFRPSCLNPGKKMPANGSRSPRNS